MCVYLCMTTYACNILDIQYLQEKIQVCAWMCHVMRTSTVCVCGCICVYVTASYSGPSPAVWYAQDFYQLSVCVSTTHISVFLHLPVGRERWVCVSVYPYTSFWYAIVLNWVQLTYTFSLKSYVCVILFEKKNAELLLYFELKSEYEHTCRHTHTKTVRHTNTQLMCCADLIPQEYVYYIDCLTVTTLLNMEPLYIPHTQTHTRKNLLSFFPGQYFFVSLTDSYHPIGIHDHLSSSFTPATHAHHLVDFFIGDIKLLRFLFLLN